MAVRGKGSSRSLGDAAAAAPAPAAAAAAAANAAAAAAAPAAAAASAAPAAAAAAGLHPRCPVESSAIFRRSVGLHGRGERGPGAERAARGVRAWMCVCAPGRARQPRRPAPPASRAGGGPGAGAGRGKRREVGQGGGGRKGEDGGPRTAPSSRAGVASTVTVYAGAARLRGLLAAACSSAAGTGGMRRPSRSPPLRDAPWACFDPGHSPKLRTVGQAARPRSCRGKMNGGERRRLGNGRARGPEVALREGRFPPPGQRRLSSQSRGRGGRKPQS